MNILINSRNFSTYTAIEDELKININKNYLFNLSYLTVLEVVGGNAQQFLQGQITCDLNKLSDIQMLQGAQCNLKGRILSLMDIVLWDGIKIILPSDLSSSTQNSLSKAALLSRVSIKENPQFKLYGFLLQNSHDVLPGSTFFSNNLYAQSHGAGYCYYHIGNGFYIFIIDAEFEQEFLKKFNEHKQLLGSLTWHTLRLQQKNFDIYPESRGLFLPHKVDLHLTQQISFDKGCYKGQEIIARTHYKATLKHELTLYRLTTTNSKLYSGQTLLRADNHSEFGEVVDYSIMGDGSYLIAISHLKEKIPSLLFEKDGELIELKEY